MAEPICLSSAVGQSHDCQDEVIPSDVADGQITQQDQQLQQEAQQRQQRWERVVREELKLSDRYQNVAVLMLQWDEHLDVDLHCGPEVQELKQLFEDDLNYHCEEVVLLNNERRPQAQLEKAITGFVCDHDGPPQQNLLIVYYSGHGYVKLGPDHKPGDFHISGTQGPTDSVGRNRYRPEACWERAEASLHGAEADVLLIMDCCFAGSIMKGSKQNSHAFQLLAAGGKDDMAIVPGPGSYTRRLIDALKINVRNARDRFFSASDLNDEIKRLTNWESKAQWYNRMPSYYRSIYLAPLRPEASTNNVLQPATGYVDLRITFSGSTNDKQRLKEMDELARGVAQGVRQSEVHILGIDLKECDLYKKKDMGSTVFALTAALRLQAPLKRKRSDVSYTEGRPRKSLSLSEARGPTDELKAVLHTSGAGVKRVASL